MNLFNQEEFENFIRSNFELIIETRDYRFLTEIPGKCDVCNKDAFMKVHEASFQNIGYSRANLIPGFNVFYFECPNCRRKSFLHAVQLEKEIIEDETEDYAGDKVKVYEFYKLFRLPSSDETFENTDIPDIYLSLKKTVSEAVFSLSYGKYLASAILFRRAIQIIVKDILGGQGKNLYSQLEWLKTNKNKLDIELGSIFHDNSKIIKDIGNQGAHPDDDITLHDFTKQDAEGLHDLFLSIIHEIFIKPSKMKELQEELKKRRKLI